MQKYEIMGELEEKHSKLLQEKTELSIEFANLENNHNVLEENARNLEEENVLLKQQISE